MLFIINFPNKGDDFVIALLIGILVISLDQITKIIVVACKPVASGHGFLEFNLTYNTGAAFSFMDNNTLFLAILSLIATIALIYVSFKHFKFQRNKLIHISIGLLIGGAAGNMIDRFLTVFGAQKGVVDFIRPEDCPVHKPLHELQVKKFKKGENLESVDRLYSQMLEGDS